MRSIGDSLWVCNYYCKKVTQIDYNMESDNEAKNDQRAGNSCRYSSWTYNSKTSDYYCDENDTNDINDTNDGNGTNNTNNNYGCQDNMPLRHTVNDMDDSDENAEKGDISDNNSDDWTYGPRYHW